MEIEKNLLIYEVKTKRGRMQDFELEHPVEIWGNGQIEISVPCSCGFNATMRTDIDELDEIVRRAKVFRDRCAGPLQLPEDG